MLMCWAPWPGNLMAVVDMEFVVVFCKIANNHDSYVRL
jgi:hypothetical protein